jgi:hypothetical protein
VFRGVTILPHSRFDCFEIWKPQLSGALRACQGIIKFVTMSKNNVEYKQNTKMFLYQLMTAVCVLAWVEAFKGECLSWFFSAYIHSIIIHALEKK